MLFFFSKEIKEIDGFNNKLQEFNKHLLIFNSNNDLKYSYFSYEILTNTITSAYYELGNEKFLITKYISNNNDIFYQKSLNFNDKVKIFPITYNFLNKEKKAISVLTPIYNKNQVIEGYLFLIIEIKNLEEIFNKSELSNLYLRIYVENQYFFFTNYERTIIFHYSDQYFLEYFDKYIVNKKNLSKIDNAIKNNNIFIFKQKSPYTKEYSKYFLTPFKVHFENQKWIFVSVIPVYRLNLIFYKLILIHLILFLITILIIRIYCIFIKVRDVL